MINYDDVNFIGIIEDKPVKRAMTFVERACRSEQLELWEKHENALCSLNSMLKNESEKMREYKVGDKFYCEGFEDEVMVCDVDDNEDGRPYQVYGYNKSANGGLAREAEWVSISRIEEKRDMHLLIAGDILEGKFKNDDIYVRFICIGEKFIEISKRRGIAGIWKKTNPKILNKSVVLNSYEMVRGYRLYREPTFETITTYDFLQYEGKEIFNEYDEERKKICDEANDIAGKIAKLNAEERVLQEKYNEVMRKL